MSSTLAIDLPSAAKSVMVIFSNIGSGFFFLVILSSFVFEGKGSKKTA
jgi:hypothetical protein